MAPNNLSMFLESDFTLSLHWYLHLVCRFLFLFATLSAVWTPEMSDTHRSIHHVRFAVPQGLYCVEDINHTLSLGHLTDNAAGAEYSATPAAISVKGQRQKILARHWTKTSSGLTPECVSWVIPFTGICRVLTGSAQWFFPLPPLPRAATGRPAESAWGRSVWKRGPLYARPSPGTGTVEPSGNPPGAERPNEDVVRKFC